MFKHYSSMRGQNIRADWRKGTNSHQSRPSHCCHVVYFWLPKIKSLHLRKQPSSELFIYCKGPILQCLVTSSGQRGRNRHHKVRLFLPSNWSSLISVCRLQSWGPQPGLTQIMPPGDPRTYSGNLSKRREVPLSPRIQLAPTSAGKITR